MNDSAIVIVLKHPDGSFFYTRPMGRRVHVDMPAGDFGVFVTPLEAQKDNESETEWLDNMRADVINEVIDSVGPYSPTRMRSGRIPLPPEGLTLEWLSKHSTDMCRQDCADFMNKATLQAEPVGMWCDRIEADSKEQWSQKKKTLAEMKAQGAQDVDLSIKEIDRLLEAAPVARIPANAIPADEISNKYRDCWTWTDNKPVVNIDMAKARGQKMAELRGKRNAALDELDKQSNRYSKDKKKSDEIDATKQLLRDATIAIEANLNGSETLQAIDAVKLPEVV